MSDEDKLTLQPAYTPTDDDIRLYGEIRTVFERNPDAAIDCQEETVDILQVMQALRGDKTTFLGMADDETRAGPYREVVKLAKDHGCLSGVGEVNVHHRYRHLKIVDESIAREVDGRSSQATRVFWVTRSEGIHEKFVSGDTSSLSDTELLDYPRCCAAWHYDCYFARGVEAFADVYAKTTSADNIVARMREMSWHQGSGWFLPREYYLAGILRGNQVYPFVDHIACPDCLKSIGSPSGVMNLRNEDAIRTLDPSRHAAVLKYARSLPARISAIVAHPGDAVTSEIDEYDLSVRARDAYVRHSRYLFKALGLLEQLPSR